MSNTHAHLRIVYLRALLNLFKGIIRILDMGINGEDIKMLEFVSIFITKASSIVHVLKLKFETHDDNNSEFFQNNSNE